MAGKSKKDSFTAKVLAAVYDIGGDVSAEKLIVYLFLQTKKECKRLYDTLYDLCRAGKIERVRRGIYRRKGAKMGSSPTIQAKMWSIIRARRVVSVADLQELAGASENYAREYLQMLCGRGIITKFGNKYRLTDDPGPQVPTNNRKAEKMRKLRVQKKKEALEAIDAARAAVLAIPD